jgi:hypothetical protein
MNPNNLLTVLAKPEAFPLGKSPGEKEMSGRRPAVVKRSGRLQGLSIIKTPMNSLPNNNKRNMDKINSAVSNELKGSYENV